MKLTYVELNGFRGYREPLRIDFADRFTIIDGRNGAGKSTIFDAIEFALTGRISRYDDIKAAGETFADYIWWRGAGKQSAGRYVKVGFRDEKGAFEVARSEFEDPSFETLANAAARLCDSRIAPATPLPQLCASTIIRDEQITTLSLDLRETDRYALLRGTLGANDAETWIEKAAALVALAKKRFTIAQLEVTQVNTDLSLVSRRLDQVRASLVADTALTQTLDRLRRFAETALPPDQLAGPVRERIAQTMSVLEGLRKLSVQWTEAAAARLRLPALAKEAERTAIEKQSAQKAIEALPPVPTFTASSVAEDARKLVHLVTLGRHFGLRDGHCPLCNEGLTKERFEAGARQAEEVARRLNENAAKAATQEQQRAEAAGRLAAATRAADLAEASRANTAGFVEAFDKQRSTLGVDAAASHDQLVQRTRVLERDLEAVQQDLRVLDTLRLNSELERVQRSEADAKTRLARAQEKLARIRKAEGNASALHDAARRAASETLDRRLERVLPLMSEMYRRLRPHAVWTDIEYAIRGDVRRFLTLQVGEDLNPQFLFSSGQRRATGLAFLLSVNLSLAWSKWRSILLDDPVQHVDDYRALHLAELLAHLVAGGRQIICAVEDAALADLMCRRLPVEIAGCAKRVTLGPKPDGAAGVLEERPLSPPLRRALLPEGHQQAG